MLMIRVSGWKWNREGMAEMDNLKPCPFCGGEVAIAEAGTDAKKWMFISRAHGKNKCTCRVFMESGVYWFDCPEKDKERIKADLIESWNKRIYKS